MITGASSGIGLEFARVFAKNNYDLVLVARTISRLREIKLELEKEYKVAVAILQKDLSNPLSPAQIYRETKKRGLQIDILVNNAGFGNFGRFSQTELVRELSMIQVNVTSLTEMTKLYLRDMVKNNNGRILNVASTAAFQPGPMMAVYYATKAYVLSFSEAIAEELKSTRVKVTALCPGPTETSFQRQAHLEGTMLAHIPHMPTAKSVAQFGYDSLLKGKVVAVHGVRSKALAQTVRFLPRRIVRKIVMSAQK